MKVPKTLNIKGVLLNKEQLKNYLENIASDHTIRTTSDKNTYPVPRVIQNFEYITKTYDMLNGNLKLGINIHQAGEWLLDNYYIIEESVKEVRKNLPLKKYIKFPGIMSGEYAGFARCYVLASEIIAYTDGNFKTKDLEEFLESYQNKKTLSMDEIWNISLFFKIALIERIRDICEKIYVSQMQKLKVENIIERLVENKPKEKIKFNVPPKILNSEGNSYSFIEYMSYKLKKYGKKGIAYLNILEEEINKQGMTLGEVIKKEHFDVALKKVSMGNAIKSIHALQRMNLSEVFENINGVEDILKKDPSKTYENMEYKTKEYYRNKIEEIAKNTRFSEIYIARKMLELAKNAENESITNVVENKLEDATSEEELKKKRHIGYYLNKQGLQELYKALGLKKKPFEKVLNFKINLYIYGIFTLSLIFSVMCGAYVYYVTNKNLTLGLLEMILIFIPLTEIVTKTVQNILSKCVKPKPIYKMDFSEGVPKEYSTLIAIPTILKNEQDVKRIFKKLEVYFLANKSENIYCTILGDCTSSKNEIEDVDTKIMDVGIYETERLNEKYGKGIFNFIYRKRLWNDKENIFMGWERKRGLLTELNHFLYNNNEHNSFLINTLNKNLNIKYVITLDSDTELTLNSGIELIEAMAHPLNKPEIENKKVKAGFGIIQPRVGINLEKSMQSRFCEIFAGSRRSRFIYKCNI